MITLNHLRLFLPDYANILLVILLNHRGVYVKQLRVQIHYFILYIATIVYRIFDGTSDQQFLCVIA